MRILVAILLCLAGAPSWAQSARTPYASAASEQVAQVKNNRGQVFQIRGSNLTANTGYLVLINVLFANIPTNAQALVPIACAKVAANSDIVPIDFSLVPAAMNTGIVVVFTAATTCYTRTDASTPSGLITVLYE